VLDCAIIYILSIIEHNGDVSPQNHTGSRTTNTTALYFSLF